LGVYYNLGRFLDSPYCKLSSGEICLISSASPWSHPIKKPYIYLKMHSSQSFETRVSVYIHDYVQANPTAQTNTNRKKAEHPYFQF
jgi:hypothetical protein